MEKRVNNSLLGHSCVLFVSVVTCTNSFTFRILNVLVRIIRFMLFFHCVQYHTVILLLIMVVDEYSLVYISLVIL